MKTFAAALFLLAIACTGCMSRYEITLANGDVITTRGRPHLSPDKHVWVYKDSSGQLAGIPAGNVTQVAPRGESESATQFKPATSR